MKRRFLLWANPIYPEGPGQTQSNMLERVSGNPGAVQYVMRLGPRSICAFKLRRHPAKGRERQRACGLPAVRPRLFAGMIYRTFSEL